MNYDDFIDKYKELGKKDPERASAVFNAYQEDPYLTWEGLLNITERDKNKKSPVGENLVETLFGENAELAMNPKTYNYFLKQDYDVLKEKAIDAGYVHPIGADATEEERMNQRKEMGQLYKILGELSLPYARKNIVNEYEKSPWYEKIFNELFLRNFTQRMKENALKGEGSTGYTDLNLGDFGALFGDLLGDAFLGEATAAKGVAALPVAAGAGLVDAYTRDNYTQDNMDFTDYLKDIGISAAASPVAISGYAKFLGDKLKKFGNGTKKNWAKDAGELVEDAGLKIAGEDVDLSKYGKTGKALLSVVENLRSPISVAAEQQTNNKILGFDDLPLLEKYKAIKKEKPEAVKKMENRGSDYGIDNRLTPAESKIVKQIMNEKMAGNLSDEDIGED